MRSFTTFLALPLVGVFTVGGCTGDDTGGTESSTGQTATEGSTGTTEATTGGSISSTGGSNSDSATEGTAGTTGTTVGTIGTEGTEGTTETTEGTTESTIGPDVCEPDGGALVRWRLLPESDDFVDFEWDLMCEVLSVGPTKEDGVGMEMSCTDGDELVKPNPVLEVNAEPATELVAFAPGMKLRMIYGESHPWWTERWIRLESEGSGDLLFAGVVGSSLIPDDKTDVFSPYQPQVQGDLCPALAGECGDQERLSIRFTGEGDDPQTWDLADGTFDIIAGDPGLSTWVDSATRFVGLIDCTDTPQAWYSIGMVFDGQE